MESYDSTLIRTLLRRINELEDIVRFLEAKLCALNAQSDSFDVGATPIQPDLDWDFETPKK